MTRRKPHACHMLVERLSAYLDGDLDAAACERIRRHAAACPRCSELIGELQETVGLCHRAGQAPLPAAVRARARARIRALLDAGATAAAPSRNRSRRT